MSEPVADHVPPLPPAPAVEPERLDVAATAAGAVDLDAQQPQTASAPDAAMAGAPSSAPNEEGLTRAQRRALAEQQAAAQAAEASVLDHPAVLIGLSVLTLVAVVFGVDQASQGNGLLLLPAVVLVAAYVVVVRRRRARR